MLHSPLVMSSSASFVVPLSLIIAAVLLGWILYESLGPGVNNMRTAAPITQPAPAQSTPKLQ